MKNLRQMIADTHLELTEKVVDRELSVADKALAYATDTVTYFFYLIAGASTFSSWSVGIPCAKLKIVLEHLLMKK